MKFVTIQIKKEDKYIHNTFRGIQTLSNILWSYKLTSNI